LPTSATAPRWSRPQGRQSACSWSPANPQSGDQQINILNAARRRARVLRRIGGRAVVGPDVESIVGRGHFAVEEAMKQSGLAWCVLSPGLFMQNTLAQAASIKNDGKMVLPFAKDLPLALIDVRDTGALGARVLRDPAKHAGKVYDFTGVTTNYEAFAKVFSEVLGRPIAYVAAALDAAEQAMKGRNMPDWLVGHMIAMARAGGKGAFSKENTQPIRDIVGRAPITTRQFVQDHKAAFV
jgi:uncharacterized protein YbjT (DUF2867 family)